MRGFNEEYVRFMAELGMEPRTTAPGAKERNGDVEALDGTLKRLIRQRLLLRESGDFGRVREYEEWLTEVLEKANRLETKKLQQELEVMKAVQLKWATPPGRAASVW